MRRVVARTRRIARFPLIASAVRREAVAGWRFWLSTPSGEVVILRASPSDEPIFTWIEPRSRLGTRRAQSSLHVVAELRVEPSHSRPRSSPSQRFGPERVPTK
jgi:hypothetical protein